MNSHAHKSDFPTVAVLDDDGDVTASIAAMLRRFDMRAVEYTDPAMLAAQDGDRGFDAFVLDWLLGGDTTALALIESIRACHRNAAAPIFLLSGNLAVGGVPSDPSLLEAIDRHRLVYRAKPYSTIKLARELQESLSGVQP